MPPITSLYSRLNFGRTFAGAAAFGTVVGSYFYARSGVQTTSITIADWSRLPISRFDRSFISPPGYDPSARPFPSPPGQPSYAANPLVDVITNGHLYDFTSAAFKLTPEALDVLKGAGSAVAVPLILSFAGGDGMLARPESEKANYASDFEYTKAVFRSGNFPDNCEVILGESLVHMSDLVVAQRDGGLALSLRATTTPLHLFDGNARWELQIDKEGWARTNISGSGQACLFAFDGVNNAVAAPLWTTTTEKFGALAEAMAKDRDVLQRSADHSELRSNVVNQADLPRASQYRESFLRALSAATGPIVGIKACVAAGDPIDLKGGTAQNIHAVVNLPQLPAENDFIAPEEQQQIAQSASASQSSDQPLLGAEDLAPFASSVPTKPVNTGESEAEREREAREAEARREEQERERRAEEERERERRAEEERERSHGGH